MPNKIRKNVGAELKDPLLIIEANPRGWAAIRAALVWAEAQLPERPPDLLAVARRAVEEAHGAGFQSSPDERITRFTGFKNIMAWQDALYAVNALPDWRFSDEVLCVGWMVELGGPEMGRGPARASFWKDASRYIGGSRSLYNNGMHGNGPGWPMSLSYRGRQSRG